MRPLLYFVTPFNRQGGVGGCQTEGCLSSFELCGGIVLNGRSLVRHPELRSLYEMSLVAELSVG